jgi:type III pantothenate kinase
MAEFLLIDNSNSFTKFALSSRERLGANRKLPTAELNRASVLKILHGWRFEHVVLCSVVPAKALLLERCLRSHPCHRVSAGSPLGVKIEYPQPSTIGADRLANACAAAALFGAPSVVVDFGTAVSFDILSKGNTYVGGVIAPGLAAMTDYLHQRTALLPKIDLLEPPDAIGKSTRHAMLAGAVYGYRGLVREILRQIQKSLKLRRMPRVIATGGYAELIASDLPEIAEVHPRLTLEGLRLIAGSAFSTNIPSPVHP